MIFPKKYERPHPVIPGAPCWRIPTRVKHIELFCIASDGMGWDHVSVSVLKRGKMHDRCPTWQEMCLVKNAFWDSEEAVVQFHPPESEYVNNHPYCLHLWKPQFTDIPLPVKEMVGLK